MLDKIIKREIPPEFKPNIQRAVGIFDNDFLCAKEGQSSDPCVVFS